MTIQFQRARFLTSVPETRLAPADSGAEVAFAGRSNAGKSSALNCITAQRSLARTSKTPGRTQQIVIFELDENRRIADLPGYGYAKVPLKLKAHWRTVMARYFKIRKCLRGVVLVMDIRHPILLTKADKLKRGPAQSTLLKVRRELPAIASVQVFSSSKKEGLGELVDKLSDWYEYDDKQG